MSGDGWDRGELEGWLRSTGHGLEEFQPLPGDVSPRRYARLRLSSGRAAIVARYPADLREACARFAETTRLLDGAGVRVPAVLESDCERGWMLLEDVGEQSLFDLAATPLAERIGHFREAVAVAGRIAALPAAEVAQLSPRLDGELMRRELHQTIELYLQPRNLLPDGLTELLEQLCEELDREVPRPCHRDFMARNLVPTGSDELAVLDHQDLRLGPPGYDLASLLNDSFFPPARIEAELLESALEDGPSRPSYHRAAVQRTLKAIGTFSAFAARGFDRHLGLIPPTLSRSLAHMARLPEAEALLPELKARWTPVLAGAPPTL